MAKKKKEYNFASIKKKPEKKKKRTPLLFGEPIIPQSQFFHNSMNSSSGTKEILRFALCRALIMYGFIFGIILIPIMLFAAVFGKFYIAMWVGVGFLGLMLFSLAIGVPIMFLIFVIKMKATLNTDINRFHVELTPQLLVLRSAVRTNYGFRSLDIDVIQTFWVRDIVHIERFDRSEYFTKHPLTFLFFISGAWKGAAHHFSANKNCLYRVHLSKPYEIKHHWSERYYRGYIDLFRDFKYSDPKEKGFHRSRTESITLDIPDIQGFVMSLKQLNPAVTVDII